jgi:hypothetical protein
LSSIVTLPQSNMGSALKVLIFIVEHSAL